MTGDVPQGETERLFELLIRRGAFFSHSYSIYKYGRSVMGYRLNIPMELPWEPFYQTLKESGLAQSVAETPVELPIGPFYPR